MIFLLTRLTGQMMARMYRARLSSIHTNQGNGYPVIANVVNLQRECEVPASIAKHSRSSSRPASEAAT
jgi:hypothetical protein